MTEIEKPLTEQEVREWFLANVKEGKFPSLVLDEKCRLSDIRQYAPSRNLYIDCARLRDGDLEVYAMAMNWVRLKWVVFDNIDRIPKGLTNRNEWEHIVKYALRNEDWDVCDGINLPLDSLKTIARCSHFPEYLKGVSLSALVFDFNRFNS